MSSLIASEPQTIIVGRDEAARPIAYRHAAAEHSDATGIFWLSGFMSDMASTKATALASFAEANGLSCTLFDYSGHGVSGGAFTDGTIGRWLEEARAVFERVSAGPQIIVGSSMGGHIALMLIRALQRDARVMSRRIKGLVLIAPAWDMTEDLMWKKFPDEARRDIMARGFHQRPSAYDQPYTITRALIEDGRSYLLRGTTLDVAFPVIIIQGLLDADVPAAHTREMLDFVRGDDISLIEIVDGEHRLSRPQDLKLLFEAVAKLAGLPSP